MDPYLLREWFRAGWRQVPPAVREYWLTLVGGVLWPVAVLGMVWAPDWSAWSWFAGALVGYVLVVVAVCLMRVSRARPRTPGPFVLVRRDGGVVPLGCVFEGTAPDGIHHWALVLPAGEPPPVPGDVVRGGVLPGRSSVSLPVLLNDPDTSVNGRPARLHTDQNGVPWRRT